MTTTGQRIRNLRMEAHMSQGDLARKAGIDQTLLSSYELDRALPVIRTAIKIAKALDTGLDDIFLPCGSTKTLNIEAS